MQTVPLQPVPSQLTSVVLGGQNCQIFVYQKSQGCFVDINADGIDIVVGVLVRNAVPLICREYAGFIGNLLFIDTQSYDDPSYEGLGSRWNLVYLTAEENVLI
jgi:hypothetical protein